MSDSLTQPSVSSVDSSPQAPAATTTTVVKRPSTIRRSLDYEVPYILMLVLALAGATLHLPIMYWVALTPFFGIICIIAGWRNFKTGSGRLELVYSQLAIW